MLIFILSAAKTMRLLSSYIILPRNASDFTGSHLRVDLKNFSRGETPGPLLTKGGSKGKGLQVPTFTGWEGRIRKRARQGRRK